ncbi:hypothetical protein [Methanobacterium sp. MBAC-LM]
MFFKFFSFEIQTVRSYYDLGKYTKELLISLKSKKIRIEFM